MPMYLSMMRQVKAHIFKFINVCFENPLIVVMSYRGNGIVIYRMVLSLLKSLPIKTSSTQS